MASRKRKPVKLGEFGFVFAFNWEPVEMSDNTIPASLRGIPSDKVYGIYASGQAPEGLLHMSAAELKEKDSFVVGGIDVFRYAEPEDGVRFNKDHYEVIFDPTDQKHLAIVGPSKDPEHWTDELSPHLRHFGAEKVEEKRPHGWFRVRAWSGNRLLATIGSSWVTALISGLVINDQRVPSTTLALLFGLTALAPTPILTVWAWNRPHLGRWHFGKILVLWGLLGALVIIFRQGSRGTEWMPLVLVGLPLVVLTWSWLGGRERY